MGGMACKPRIYTYTNTMYLIRMVWYGMMHDGGRGEQSGQAVLARPWEVPRGTSWWL